MPKNPREGQTIRISPARLGNQALNSTRMIECFAADNFSSSGLVLWVDPTISYCPILEINLDHDPVQMNAGYPRFLAMLGMKVKVQPGRHLAV